MTEPSRDRVLFLAYAFPPLGGSGVQRSLKFVKYLPTFGWQPTVLTVKPISYFVYDPSLLRELPPDVTIERTESLDPQRLAAILLRDHKRVASTDTAVKHTVFSTNGKLTRLYQKFRSFLLFPDPQIAWMPFAFQRGLEIIERERPRVIYSPGVPYSSAVLAHLLSRRTGLPYVIDFRDGWTDDKYIFKLVPTPLHRWGHRELERRVVSNASGVVVYGDWLGERLAARYPSIADRIIEITNGYDPADRAGVVPTPKGAGVRRLVYSGSLFVHHRPNLAGLLEALHKLPAAVRDTLEVVFVGQVYAGAEAEVAAAGLSNTVKFTGYVTHGQALEYLESADATLLFVQPGDLGAITGKVFELLMIQKPILASIPDGECARILRVARFDQWINWPMDSDALARNILGLVEGGFQPVSDPNIDAFSRVKHTERLARLFDRVAASPVAAR